MDLLDRDQVGRARPLGGETTEEPSWKVRTDWKSGHDLTNSVFGQADARPVIVVASLKLHQCNLQHR